MWKAVLGVMMIAGAADSWAQSEEFPPLEDLASVGGDECLIEPSTVVDVGSPVRGVLARVRVDRGDWVKKGQLVAQIDGRAERAAVELAKSRVAYTRRRVQRNEEMARDELVSQQEVDEMETEARLAELELAQNQAVLSIRDIASPVNGVVVDRELNVGEFVDEEPIMRLAQINPLHVEVVLPVSKFGTLDVGATATLFPQAPVGGEYKATIDVIDQVIDAASETFRVRLVLKNPGNKIPAGLRCTVAFEPQV